MTRIAVLPMQARALEAALHSICDQGRWDGDVEAVWDDRADRYVLELREPRKGDVKEEDR